MKQKTSKLLILNILLLLNSSLVISQNNIKLSDFLGDWSENINDTDIWKDMVKISFVNNKIKINPYQINNCPAVYEFSNSKFENGKILTKRKQFGLNDDTIKYSNTILEIKNNKLIITDLGKSPCGEKIVTFIKKSNPIDNIIGTYKMDDKDYNKHMSAIFGNYGKYIKISKNGNSIKVSEYDLNESQKKYIKYKYYKYDESTNTVSGINYMQDEYDKFEKKYKLNFNGKKIIRNQEWWGFPDNLILNYTRIK